MDEINNGSLLRRFMFQFVRHVPGEGNDQLVDDLFTSHDGRFVYVSRPSFADVVAIDMHSGEIVWRTPIAGYRADHAAISPDGKTFMVSASTARKVQAIDTATGKIIGEFESGDQPHENTYSTDGKLIYHASIGKVFVPTTASW
jgi:outer membrane protein assembly factor BamB